MARVMEHESVWLADARIPEREALAADLDADLVVVGGGITGLTTALLAQRQGARVVVLEGRRIGAGSTGRSTGKVTSQHTAFAARMIERHGEAIAQAYAQANQEAVELVARLAEELGIDCRLERADAYAYTTDPARAAEIDREVEAAQRLGLPAVHSSTTPLPFEVAGAVRFTGQVQLNPAAYAAGLATAIEQGGGSVFEHSRALDVHDGARVEVEAVGGSVTADHAVVATLLPITDIGGFFAKAQPSRSYGIAVTLAEPPPEGMHISIDSPTRSTRPWRGDEHGLVVVGDGHETGHGEDLEQHYRNLEQWAREHFPVREVAYRWSAQDYQTLDELPYVGRCPRTKNVLVATGFRKWGLSGGTAAGMLLADLLADRESPWLAVFDATRTGDPEALGKGIEVNAHVAKRFVGDRLGRLRAEDIGVLDPGEGAIVRVGERAVAACRDADGCLYALSPTCTHLGCTVQWNDAEASWDCPCHGSRFAVDGAVLDGPAVQPLERYEVDGAA